MILNTVSKGPLCLILDLDRRALSGTRKMLPDRVWLGRNQGHIIFRLLPENLYGSYFAFQMLAPQ